MNNLNKNGDLKLPALFMMGGALFPCTLGHLAWFGQ